jgi:hypothetical protein
MKNMVNFEEAIKRPFTDFKKLGIGILIYFVAVIPFIGWLASFFVAGYGLECAKTAMKKNPKLPEWTDLGNLWIKGFFNFLIGLIYIIPLGLIGAFTIGSAVIKNWELISASNPNPIALAAEFEGIGGGLLLFFLIMIVTFYIIPMAIMRFVESGKFSNAFELGTVFKKAFTSKYFAAWIILFIYAMVVGWIVALLIVATTITVIIPLILMGFWNMILTITSMTVYKFVQFRTKIFYKLKVIIILSISRYEQLHYK